MSLFREHREKHADHGNIILIVIATFILHLTCSNEETLKTKGSSDKTPKRSRLSRSIDAAVPPGGRSCHARHVQTCVGRRSAGEQRTDLRTHAGTVWEVMRLFSQREGRNVTAAAPALSDRPALHRFPLSKQRHTSP